MIEIGNIRFRAIQFIPCASGQGLRFPTALGLLDCAVKAGNDT
jgi:hypothetical protein